jgi:hypothetical protein
MKSIVIVLLVAFTAGAQTQPADGKLTAEITAVIGMVQVREASDKPWQKAAVGRKLTQDAEFRTGPKSSVQFVIPPDQTIALDRLGTVKLLTAVAEKGKVKTDLGMKYGRTRYDIEEAGIQHDATIIGPSSTLAVRGTKVSLTDSRPFAAEAISLTGRADLRDQRKQASVGAKNAGKAKIDSDKGSAAETALAESFIDPTVALARTPTEANLVANLLASGSTLSIDRESGIKVVRGGRPPTDAELVPSLPGVLNFVARWNTPTDLNLAVGAPGGLNGEGEFVYPALGLDRTASGGATAFDHRGGPHGGVEIAYWPADHPKGLYGLGLVLVSGQPTVAQVDAFLDGKRIGIFDGQSLKNSVSVPVFPLAPGLGEGTLAGVVPVGTSLPGSTSSPQAGVQQSKKSAQPAKPQPALTPRSNGRR